MKYCKKVYALLFLCCFFIITSCTNFSKKEKEYYSDKNNYVTVSGVIDHILFDEQNLTVYLGFSMMSEELDDNAFKIVGKNYSILNEVDAKNKLKLGEIVTFVTAPKYFGDGYVMPIVALNIENEVLLDFEIGFANFIDWVEK